MKIESLLALDLALFFSAFTASAHAEDAPEKPVARASPREPAATPRVNPKPTWYGYQTLLADTATISLLFVNDDGACVTGLGGFVLGAPIIHVAHRNGVRAGVSLGLRVGLPVIGGLIGAAAASCPGTTTDENAGFGLCGIPEVGGGIVLGALTAIVLDAAALAWEKPKPEPSRSVTVAPTLAVGPKQAQLALAGTF